MKFEVLYETKSDFYQKFWNNDFQTLLSLISQDKVTITETEKGLLQFHFKGFKSKAQMGSNNKVQVFYANRREKNKVHSMLESLLGERLKSKKITCFSIDTPHGKPPQNFKLSVCPETYRYTLLQSIGTKRGFRKGAHPLLWVLLFLPPSLSLLPKLLELLSTAA